MSVNLMLNAFGRKMSEYGLSFVDRSSHALPVLIGDASYYVAIAGDLLEDYGVSGQPPIGKADQAARERPPS